MAKTRTYLVPPRSHPRFGPPEPRHEIAEFIEEIPKKLKARSEIRMSNGDVWLSEEPAEFLSGQFGSMPPNAFGRLLVKDKGGRISWTLLRAGFVASVRPV